MALLVQDWYKDSLRSNELRAEAISITYQLLQLFIHFPDRKLLKDSFIKKKVINRLTIKTLLKVNLRKMTNRSKTARGDDLHKCIVVNLYIGCD